MDDSIVILGRQPALGLAELESLYGASRVTAVGDEAARLAVMPCSVDFARLGGAIRLCKILTIQETTNWKQLMAFIAKVAPQQAAKMADGKMHLGLSVYGLEVSPPQILAAGLTIKNAIHKQTSRTVRLVPNKSTTLNTAQVIHNKLIDETGWELVFIRDGNRTIVAQTLSVQDIDSYSQRDFGRPKRDARVGMLPPKLAQIIINLATGPDEFNAIRDSLSGDICLKPEDDAKMHAGRGQVTVLDPFCGTGVVLQEALLMGYRAYGTDLEPRMIDYSRINLEWLARNRQLPPYTVAAGDATTYLWEDSIAMIASETYLGRPFTSAPDAEVLARTVSECNLIIKKFLRQIHDQLKPGTRLCLAVPAWQIRSDRFKGLPLIDALSDIGYNRIRFERVQEADLLYYRTDQIVARELLVIIRK